MTLTRLKWTVAGTVFALLHLLQTADVVQAQPDTPPVAARAVRPDPLLTPGIVSDGSAEDVCRAGYARQARNVPQSERRAVFAEYKVVPLLGERFEIDHLVPLELGGANSINNLWPQPMAGAWTAGEKDRLENALHRDVCTGQTPLGVAQEAIRRDWIGAYRQRFGAGGGPADGG